MSSVDYESTHYLPSYPVMVKVGRFLDESDETGIYKI